MQSAVEPRLEEELVTNGGIDGTAEGRSAILKSLTASMVGATKNELGRRSYEKTASVTTALPMLLYPKTGAPNVMSLTFIRNRCVLDTSKAQEAFRPFRRAMATLSGDVLNVFYGRDTETTGKIIVYADSMDIKEAVIFTHTWVVDVPNRVAYKFRNAGRVFNISMANNSVRFGAGGSMGNWAIEMEESRMLIQNKAMSDGAVCALDRIGELKLYRLGRR